MRYRLQRHDGTDCSATMVPITVLRMVPIQRYRHLCLGMGFSSCQEDENFQKKDTNLPSFPSIVISEVQTGDAQPVT